MLFLEFFGGASVRTESGVLRHPGLQQRRIAVLAIAAASPGGRVSREHVIGYLWPDTDPNTARHRLGDAVHGLRRALGKDAILSNGTDLSLNVERIRSDVGDFTAAVACGACETAAALHSGAFLDGFFVRSAPEFERWAEEQRERFSRQYAECLRVLAKRCESENDWPGAAHWWGRLVALDPYDSHGALTFMRALERTGDLVGVLRHANLHAAVLRNDLDVDPDPEVLALANRVRDRRSASWEMTSTATSDGEQRASDPLGAIAASSTAAAANPPPLELPSSSGGAGRPEGIGAPASPPRAHPFSLALVALVGLVVLGFALLSSNQSRLAGHTADRTVIAVLPFESLDPGGPYTYLAAGLHAELLTQLSRMGGLTVISRTSVMPYEGTRRSLRHVARDLGVGSIVEGTVQVLDGRLLVNVQLVDAHTDAQLWSNRYDRSLTEALAIRSEIARHIAVGVGVTLSGMEQYALLQRPTVSADAYLLYLQGREYQQRPGHDPANLQIAQKFLEEALAQDPGFALAHAALSEVHGRMYWFRYDPTADRAKRQWEAAETALRLAPELPEAHVALGWAHLWGSQQPRLALASFERAIEGMPGDGSLWEELGLVYRRLGAWEEAEAAFTMAARLNPRRAELFNDLGGNRYQFTRQYAAAVEAYDRALRLAPDFHLAAVQKGRTYARWQGDLDTLRFVLENVPQDAALGGLGTRTIQHIRLLSWEQRPDSVLHVVDRSGISSFSWQMGFVPAPLYRAWAHRLRGDVSAATTAFGEALAVVEAALEEQPNDWRIRTARGLVLAGLGRAEEALNEAEWLNEIPGYREDAYFGTMVAEERAKVLAQAGATEAALQEITRLLDGPSPLTVHMLRLDPLWDPLRGHPDFESLLRRYESE